MTNLTISASENFFKEVAYHLHNILDILDELDFALYNTKEACEALTKTWENVYLKGK